jgi:acetyl esterase/lipase
VPPAVYRPLKITTAAPLIILLTLLLAGRAAHSQCQTIPGLTYATYVEGNGQTQALQLDLLRPAGASAPLPTVLWIHGGGWFSGSRTPIPSGPAGLCSRGYAVASVDYRFAPAWPWPTQLHDVKGAVRWLRAHAAVYGLDADRFGAWGASAGGHLAAFLGTASGAATFGNLTVDLEGTTGGNAGFSSRVEAVADWYGQTDFLALRFYPSTVDHDAANSDESHLVGAPIQQVPDRVASADPISFVTADDAPFLIMHGTVDDLVPFNQSELLVDALRAASVPVTFVPVQDVGHGGGGFTTTANHQVVYDFFDSTLKNLGAPKVGMALSPDAPEAAESGRVPGRFVLTRSGGTASPLTVQWALSGTAGLGADYAAPIQAATFPAGSSSLEVTVAPVDDLLVEGDETVELRLGFSPAYRLDAAHSTARMVLVDDDSPPGLPELTLQATDPAAAEPGPDPGILTVSRLSGAAGTDLTVRYTVAGTARNGADYAALSGSLVIPAGQTAAELRIEPIADGLLETAETVFVTLAPSPIYKVGSPASAGVLLADADLDPARPIVSLAATDPDAVEPGGSGKGGAFTVSRTGSTASSLPLDLLLSGSAQNGLDYAFVPTAVTIPAGQSRLTVSLAPQDDTAVEGPEDAVLTVEPAAAIQRGPSAGSRLVRVVLQDDEPWPGPAGFYPLPPCRLVDTRGPAGPWGAPSLAAGEIRIFPASGACGIPPDATALSVNLTAVGAAAAGHLLLFEPGAPLPATSTLNLRAGQTRANNGIYPLLGRPSALAVASGLAAGTVDVVIDVNGYFRQPAR